MLATSMPPVSEAQRLKEIPLFERFSSEELREMAPFFHEGRYEKDTVIFHERDRFATSSRRIYFVSQGCVRLVKYSAEGEGAIVRLVSLGEFFGVTAALSDQSQPYSAEALSDCTVLWLERDDFVRLAQRFPQLALDMMVALGQLLWFNYETHNQVVKKTDARVCRIILHHLNRDGYKETPEGQVLRIHLPHDYIASMTGIAYEESVRVVSRLKKTYGCIQYLRGGKIIVTDLDQLKTLAQEEEVPLTV